MNTILAIGAHPDDIEFAAGGILAKAAKSGYAIHHHILTQGEAGSHGSSEERQQEARRAASVIGASCSFGSFEDTAIYDTKEGRYELVKLIRTIKPTIILTSLPEGEMQHPDHFACGKMTRAAARYANYQKIAPELPPHRVDGVLHYLGPSKHPSDFIIDVTEVVETWKKMVLSFTSQMKTRDYFDLILRSASYLGSLIGTEYGQALVALNPIQVDDLFHIAKGCEEI